MLTEVGSMNMEAQTLLTLCLLLSVFSLLYAVSVHV